MNRPQPNEEDEVLASLRRGEIDLPEAFRRRRRIEGRQYREEAPLSLAERRRPRPRRLSSLATFFIELKIALFKRRLGPTASQAYRPEHAKRPSPSYAFRPAITGLLLELAALTVLVAVVFSLIGPVIPKAGFAPGYDSPAHGYVAQRLVEGIRSTGRLPNIDPYWYAGLEITHKLPILSYLPLMALYSITDSAMLTTRLFYLLVLVGMGLSVYTSLRLNKSDRLNSLAAAVVVPFSAGSLAFHWGVLPSFTRYSAFLLFPLVLYNATKIFDGAPINRLALAVLLSLMFPSHPMVALATILWISVYAILRAILEKQLVPLRHFVFAFIFSSLLAAWYILPFLLEEPVWGLEVPRSVLTINSMSLANQLRYIGVVFGLAATAAIIYNFSRKRLALFLTCLFGFVHALGVYGPLISLVPGAIYPFLTFFASVIGLTFLIFTSLPPQETTGRDLKPRLKKLGSAALICLLVAVIVFESQMRTDFTALRTRKFPKYQNAAIARLRHEKGPGRVMPLGYPYVFETLAISLKTGKTTPEGWYSSISPFYLQITYFYDDLRKGFLETGSRKLARWNAGYLVFTRHFKAAKDLRGRKFAEVIRDGGYKPIFDDGYFKIYKNGKPPGPVQQIRENTLVIGKFQPIATAVNPDSIASEKSVLIDDYTLAELKNYKTVVLYGFSFRDQAAARALLQKYVQDGGKVVVDTQGIDEFSQFRNKNFLGVRTKIAGLSGRTDLQVLDPTAVGRSSLKPIHLPRDRQIIYYRDLDRVFIMAVNKTGKKTRRLPVAGYKKVGRGKVYFIGGNLLFYAFNNRDTELTQVTRRIIGGAAPKTPAAATDMKIERSQPEKMVFKYESSRDWPALISRTYSPHWYARLDGKKWLSVSKMEGLIGLDLPKGNHTVTLRYGSTAVHPVSKAISALAWITAALMFFAYVRTGINLKDRQGQKENHEQT